MRNEVSVSIVVDMLTPQAPEELVVVAKFIQHEQLMDPLSVAGKF